MVAVVIAAVVLLASGYWVYETYIYKPPPIFAQIDTSLGSFEVELYPACAPATVANFVQLAQHGFYDNLVWHRIVQGFVIQTGDPNTRNGVNSTRATWGEGGSNQTVPLEWCGWLHNYAGYLAMAHLQGEVNSGTSQFFVNLTNSSTALLDDNYTVFGKVISGMNVVQAIGSVKTYQSTCLPPTCSTTLPLTEPVTPVFLTDIVIKNGP